MKWDGYLDGYFWIIKDAQIPYIYIYIYIYMCVCVCVGVCVYI